MALYDIRYALGGGFGGVENADWETIEAKSLDDALDEAYQRSADIYESYAGMYGLRSVEDIIEEDDADEAAAQDIYIDERESWLDYEAREHVEGEEE